MNAIGKWDLYGVSSQPNTITQNMEFTKDGEVHQTKGPVEGHLASWRILEDMVVISYHDVENKHSVLSFEEPNLLVGIHRYRNGATNDWILKRQKSFKMMA